MKEFWHRAVAAYGRHVADRLDEETPLLLAFLPAGIGGLMLWSGDAGSMVFGGLCCFLGLAVFLLYLGNEQRVYVEEKNEQQRRDEQERLRLDEREATLVERQEQLAYLQRTGGSEASTEGSDFFVDTGKD